MIGKPKARFLFPLMTFVLLVSSCVETPSGGRRLANTEATDTQGGDGTQTEQGQGSGPTDGGLDGDGVNFSKGKSELRFIVDPFSGTYKNKVTIPKNFTGELYLSGLNLTALKDRIIEVRFNFGRELEPVVVPATITRGSGITPQTDIEVLALSMDNRPFEQIRLLYNLFDYNDYRDENGDETLEPVVDPRNANLFCRGLNVENDPTFEGTATNTQCDGLDSEGNPKDESCLYSYAKILDTGLFYDPDASDSNPGFGRIPSEPQLDITTANNLGYTGESTEDNLRKCLPDNFDRDNIEGVLGLSFPTPSSPLIGQEFASAGDYRIFRGPFRPIGEWDWEILGSALFSDVDSATAPTGIFKKSSDGTVNSGYESFLFPRAGKLELQAGVEYFGSDAPFEPRSLESLLTSGESKFIDGCNMRVSQYNSFTNEGISSCNVTATIEIVTTSLETGDKQIITSTNDVKLQLARPSVTNFRGEEVLFQSMKTCSSSNSCGSDQCCFNGRCWSKDLVSQCLEDADVVGNRGTGEVCSSDYSCSSLCCNQSKGTCDVHVNTDQEEVLCSKAPGQSCVSKEYCRKENINECFVVKTGSDNLGNQTCALRCYNVPTFGSCKNGVCVPPVAPPVPQFDPGNPDCSNAIDPPSF
jgi:hypothetical protein